MLIDLEKAYKISKIHLFREQMELEILKSLSLQEWSKHIVFYGGTSLRLAYNSPRFSEDIDLLMLRNITFQKFGAWVRGLTSDLSGEVSVNDLHQKRKTLFALLTIRHQQLKHALPIKIELFRNPKKVSVETELRLITSPLSVVQSLILVPTLSALHQMKIDALHDRSKPRDLYDLWYLAQLQKKPLELPKHLPVFRKNAFQNELRVYLPKHHYPIIDQLWSLYESAHQKNQKSA